MDKNFLCKASFVTECLDECVFVQLNFKPNERILCDIVFVRLVCVLG